MKLGRSEPSRGQEGTLEKRGNLRSYGEPNILASKAKMKALTTLYMSLSQDFQKITTSSMLLTNYKRELTGSERQLQCTEELAMLTGE